MGSDDSDARLRRDIAKIRGMIIMSFVHPHKQNVDSEHTKKQEKTQDRGCPTRLWYMQRKLAKNLVADRNVDRVGHIVAFQFA